jgi:hypothetical protein
MELVFNIIPKPSRKTQITALLDAEKNHRLWIDNGK